GAVVQGGLVGRLARRFGEARLVIAGATVMAVSFALLGGTALFGTGARAVLWLACIVMAVGNGVMAPSLPAYVSKRAGADAQGLALGPRQSGSAMGRVVGPALGGVLYSAFSPTAPYAVGAVGLFLAAVLAAARLPD